MAFASKKEGGGEYQYVKGDATSPQGISKYSVSGGGTIYNKQEIIHFVQKSGDCHYHF